MAFMVPSRLSFPAAFRFGLAVFAGALGLAACAVDERNLENPEPDGTSPILDASMSVDVVEGSSPRADVGITPAETGAMMPEVMTSPVDTGTAFDARVAGDAGPDRSSPADAQPVVDASRDASLSPDTDGSPRDAADAGLAQEVGPTTITVHGQVIDFWGHHLPAVPVSIGSATAVTDSQGAFSIAGITPPYDVTLTVSVTAGLGPFTDGWIFQGLTRSDPTLQIYRGLPGTSGEWQFMAVTATTPDDLHPIGVGFGSADGESDTETTSTDEDFLNLLGWRGPSTTAGRAHALEWSRAGTSNTSPPTAYLGYDAHPLTADDSVGGAAAPLTTFDLSASTVTTEIVAGTVTSSTTANRANSMHVRFASGAVIALLDQTNAATTFSYLAPVLPDGATVTVAARRGTFENPLFSIAHQDGIAAASSTIALALPDPPPLTLPVDGAVAVNAASLFSWGGPGGVSIFKITFNGGTNHAFVVTARQQERLPIFPGTGFAIPGNTAAAWSIETHGRFTSVDDAASSAGMLDSFAGWEEPAGFNHASGTFCESERRAFTTSP
jgi:hypothetical protein